jgi:flagellar basal-body rod protein FlgC
MSIAGSIALSGMNVAALRFQVSASNVANAFTDGPIPGSANAGNYPSAYAPLRIDQIDTVGGGTRASIGAIMPSSLAAFDPTALYADGRGTVARPNVDLASEFTQQISARYMFAANAQVMRTDARMTGTLFSITC